MMVKRTVYTLNGITIAYMMGAVNSLLGVLLAFGLNLTLQQQAAIVGFVNASLIVLAHVSHRLGESEELLRNTAPPLPPGTTTTTVTPDTVITTPPVAT